MRALRPLLGSRLRGASEVRGGVAEAADRPALRLSVSRGGLALELEQAVRVGPVSLAELVIGLPGLRFPVDLSGGVARFRHRRGALSAMRLEVGAVELGRALRAPLRGFLGPSPLDVTLIPTAFGLVVGIATETGAIAWDLVICPSGDDLVLVIENARALGVDGPEHALALRAIHAALRPFARIAGGTAHLEGVSRHLCRELLPHAGARAPGLEGFTWAPVEALETRVVLRGAITPGPPLPGRCLRALELADLASEADQASFEGDLVRARQLYLGALERAPRHPELARRLAALDRSVGERTEAALATLVEVTSALDGGLLGAELLRAVGDVDGARVAFHRAALLEPYAPLAALAWMRVADLTEDVRSRLPFLDEAVARAPALAPPRWARLAARARLADVKGALADAQHLEASGTGAPARHEALRRAAGELLAADLVSESAALFERALRYAPDDAEALAGLGRALAAAGRGARSLELFRRAVSVAERHGHHDDELVLDLARALVDVAVDRPAAVARVRTIGAASAREPEARLLEGRWRIELGDLAGGGLALGRLRDAVERVEVVTPVRARELAALLRAAAELEERERADLPAARRTLALALRFDPRDVAVSRAFRRLSAETPAPSSAAASDPRPAVAPRPTERPSVEDDEVAVERLSEKLRADPENRAVVLALADALARLGRLLELLALLSARIEEGDAELRAELLPRRRLTLEALARASRAEGRESEAELYEMMLAGSD